MKKPNKKINNGLIVMSKGERIGVISLLSLITVLLAFSVFRPAIHFSDKDKQAFHNLDSMIAIQKQAALQQQEQQQPQSNVTTATTISTTEKTGSGRKPKTSSKANISSKTTPSPTKVIPVLDINVADSLALIALPQIGEVMASRIHRYRNRLGGFVSFDQLFEVKGMDSARFNAIKPYIILENKEIQKLEINHDEFKTLLRHPYLEYDQVKAIVNHRERKGLIKNWEQLRNITGEVNPLLEEYLVY